MVKELILDNDRVVLPGLGSFVAEIVPSTFSDRGYTINPPYRRLFFRSRPDEGDMLAKFYAESNNVQPEIAERIINDFIAELKNVLHTRKTVVFPGLGRLRATKENAVFFVKPITACFAIVYAQPLFPPQIPAIEATFTMLPAVLFFINTLTAFLVAQAGP